MLMSMASFTLPNPALVRTVRLRRPAAQLSRWASRQIRNCSLSVRMFAEPNRHLSATAGSVCVTSLPALISSQDGCA